MNEAAEFMMTVPDSVAADPEAIEVLRMWWSKQEPVMSVKPAFGDPIKFGELMAIAARHMAHGYAVRHGHDKKAAYHRILKGMSDVIKADNIGTVTEPTYPMGGNA